MVKCSYLFHLTIRRPVAPSKFNTQVSGRFDAHLVLKRATLHTISGSPTSPLASGRTWAREQRNALGAGGRNQAVGQTGAQVFGKSARRRR